MRGLLIMLWLLAVIPLGLSGCAAKNQQTSPETITLEFWTLQLADFKSTIEPMLAEYERSHPGVKIHWVDLPFSEGPKRTLTAMMSEHVPDVVNLNPDFSAVLASRGALMDMREALPQEVQKSYLPVAWQAATLRRANGDEITFGLPWYITSSVTLYNKNILAKAGLAQPPASYDELPEFARAVREKSGAYGLMPTIAESGNFLKEMKKIGVALYDDQGRAIFADNDAAVRLLSRYVEMYRQGWVPAEAITEGHQAAVGRYQAGTLGMFSIGPNFLKIVKENAPAVYEATGVAPQFPQNARFKDFSMMVVVVPRKSAHPKQAVEFAAFVTNAQNQLALAHAAPVLPSVTSALRDPYFSQVDSDDLMARGRGVSAGQLLSATEAYRIRPGQNQLNEIINHYVQLAMLGRLSPAEALGRAQREMNDILVP